LRQDRDVKKAIAVIDDDASIRSLLKFSPFHNNFALL
jgi:hypothetical protein